MAYGGYGVTHRTALFIRVYTSCSTCRGIQYKFQDGRCRDTPFDVESSGEDLGGCAEGENGGEEEVRESHCG
jgi:hypothetical protein